MATDTQSHTPPEHPFAGYVRILGKGKTGTRSLTREEARKAFGMILDDEVEALQLGAFLMLLRVKEESAAELAGFVEACRERMPPGVPLGAADLDWSSYAGKRHQHPWYLLAILLLGQAGYRVFIHGAGGHTPGRLYTEQALSQLGFPLAANWDEVAAQLSENGFSYCSLTHFCPGLQRIMLLKHLLGLRSPVNTFSRMLNPLRAAASIQSIFHPAYADLHAGADELLAQPASLVFKGESGEVEVRPQATTRLTWLRAGSRAETRVPRQFQERIASVETPSVAPLRALWDGRQADNYGLAATLGTCAAALQLLEPGLDEDGALARARHLWQDRDKESLPPCP